MKNLFFPLIAVFLMASLLSCGGKKEAKQKTDVGPQVKILATVNGVPITELDMELSARRFVHGEKGNPETTKNILEALVRSELVYQQSIELGLDKDPEYSRKILMAEAQLRAFQRQEMSARYREYIRNKAEVTDSEAKEYFEKNSERIRTKVHVWQIFSKGKESRIAEADRDLKSGMPFEKVASRRFPKLPEGMRAPWDLGYLSWDQIPAPWQDVIGRLEPGQTSDIIKGPSERFWVIRLVEKTSDPNITFDTEKEKIAELLNMQKADELSDTLLARMREKSKIVFTK